MTQIFDILNLYSNLKIKKISALKNKKFLITGCSGLIGTNLCLALNSLNIKYKLNMKITGVYASKNLKIFNTFNSKYFTFYKSDLSTNLRALSGLKFDFIFHCATYGQPNKFSKNHLSTLLLNTKTIYDLKNKIKKNGKFICFSSSEIYSGNINECTEESVGQTNLFHSRATYIESKKISEVYTKLLFKNYLIFRVSLVYGPGVKLDDTRVLNEFIVKCLNKKKLNVKYGLKNIRNYTYIYDAINIILYSICNFNKETFNLSNNSEPVTILELAKIISTKTNSKLVVEKEKNFNDSSPLIVNISNMKILNKIKNFKFTCLSDGIDKTIDWFKFVKLYK